MEKTDFLKEIPETMKKHGIETPFVGEEKGTVCAQKKDKGEKSLLQIIITWESGSVTVRLEGIDKNGYIKKDDEDLGVEFQECSPEQVETLIRLFAYAWVV